MATEVKSIEPETKQGRRNSKKDADTINQIIDLAKSLLDDEGEDIPDQEDEVKSAEAQPEANEVTTPEEPKDEGNAKRAEAILDKINEIKGGSDK